MVERGHSRFLGYGSLTSSQSVAGSTRVHFWFSSSGILGIYSQISRKGRLQAVPQSCIECRCQGFNSRGAAGRPL